MSKIGYLTPIIRNNCEVLIGEISTLKVHLKIVLEPNASKQSDKAPDYLIWHDVLGESVQLGASWRKVKRLPDGTDFEFMSITIDDMSLPSPINAGAFKNPNHGWDITWRRRQQGAVKPNNQNAE